MKHSFDVIVCGSLHLDIVVNAKALPRIDETAVGSAWKQVCGGKGGNQAVQAARAGAKTAMIGRIGEDAFGKMLQANLIREGVDVSCLSVDPLIGTGMSVAILQDDGDYGAVIVSGSNLSIDTQRLQETWMALGGGRVLILQNEVPDAVNLAIAKVAHAAGAQVIINAAPARELSQDLLELIDVLIVNRVEAEAMFGNAVTSKATARTALEKLAYVSRSVIVTLGGDGLVVATATGDIVDIEPIPVRVTSTHGAGDCFVGALCAQMATSASLLDACRVANQTAAAFVSQPHRGRRGFKRF
jgi:ribokinase